MLDQSEIEPKDVLATKRFYFTLPLFVSLGVDNSFSK